MPEIRGENGGEDVDKVGREEAEVFGGEEDDWAVRSGPEAAEGE